ncbi:DUF4055 domain-containing protein [Microbulbifer sp. OS29]|uniref:DUF4055 domain-containing protein n=1 Tax=Microbulbifer okhotskensis TaxID=2926617 RepID=A0A9X2EQ82_9GAMM|nr:DUF4055 domain-containing protein [Microbulbifer okhotskensis]MCO1336454.1 DUF4055 domain-containing protein [Microbulbifer okhotskensis]
MANDVTYQRDDFTKALPDWTLVDDICAGERVIKAKGTTYLPMPNPKDQSEANRARYLQYTDRAVFYNATGRTLQGLVGAVFRRAPSVDIPAGLEYLTSDANGNGVSIYQQSQSVVAAVLKSGRRGLLVDYPKTERQTSKAEQQAGLVRASIVSYPANQIINWRTIKVGGVHRLGLVVIRESYEETNSDGFGIEEKTQYRALKLIDGRYTVEIWRSGNTGTWIIHDTYTPLDGAGKAWDIIPFTFVGAENNDSSIDRSPLLDLANLNKAHYRNSADYEDSAFFVGQAQPWISGLTENWRDHMEKQGIYIGSRSPILLPDGGAFGFAQVEPNTLVKEAMDQKEKQMVALGARLIERGSAVKTATEAQAENESEHSVLSLVAENVSEAYTQAIQWAAQFQNVQVETEYKLNQDFAESNLDAQMLTALVQAWQSGRLPSSDLWANLRKHGVINAEKTDEVIREELGGEEPGLGLNDE